MATPPNPNEINTPRAPPPPSASTIPFTIPPLARGFLERFAAARAWWIGGASASDREEEEDGKIGGHAEAVRPAPSAAAGPAAPPGDGEARACYGIVVACVSLLLLCALVSAVGVARAFAATGVLVLLLGLAGWLAPTDAFAVALAPSSTRERRRRRR